MASAAAPAIVTPAPSPSIDSLKEAIRSLEIKLISKMEDLQKSLVDQLGERQATMDRTRQLAESAVELAQINQDDIGALQKSAFSTK